MNVNKNAVRDIPRTTHQNFVRDIYFFEISEEIIDLARKLYGDSNKH